MAITFPAGAAGAEYTNPTTGVKYYWDTTDGVWKTHVWPTNTDYLQLSGGTLTGNLSLGTNDLTAQDVTASGAISANSLSTTAGLTVGNGLTVSDGNVVMASGHGIDFSADANAAGMTSELLDDYEEGSWTPAGSSNFNNITQAAGKYVKIGRTVFVTYQFSYTSLDTSSTDSAVTGLPFTVAENNPNTGVGATGVGFGSNKHVVTYVEEQSILLNFDTNTPLTGTASTGGDFFRGSMWYYST